MTQLRAQLVPTALSGLVGGPHARLRERYDSSPLPASTWQRQGDDFVLIDHNAAAALGDAAAPLGTRCRQFHRDRPDVIADFERCYAARGTLRREYLYRAPEGGAQRYLAVTYVYVPDDLIVAHTEDVTARRQAEEVLRANARAYRTLVEQVPAIIYRAPADVSGATLFISPQVESVLGYEAAAFLNDPEFWPDQLHPEDRARAMEAFAQGRASGSPVQVEYRFRAADGREVWIRDEARLLRDDAGRPLYWQGVMLDITERRRAEVLLAAQATVLERIAQDAPLIETLAALAGAVESTSDGALASILLLAEDGATLRCIAAPSLPATVIAAMGAIPVGEGVGACGTAAARRAPVVCADIATDPAWADYRDLALGHGLRACWSLPIVSRADAPSRLLGTFALYATAPRQPGDAEWRALERSAALATLAIERAQATSALQRSAESFDSLFEAAGEGLVIHAGGPILAASRSYAAMLGYEVAEIIGRESLGFLAPESRAHSYRISQTGDERPYEAELLRADGTRLPVELSGKAIRYQGQPARLVTLRDITARREAEAALRASEANLAGAQRIAHLGGWEHDIGRDELRWSDEVFRIFGLAPQSLVPTLDVIAAATHPDDRERVARARRASLAGVAFEVDHRIIRPTGEVRAVHLQAELAHDDQGRPIKWVGIVQDVTDRRALEERLAHQAFHDALTNLPNRALFHDRLTQALARAQRSGSPCAVIFLDLDRFKTINDSLGHAAGDQLLIAVAARLRGALREGDTLARLGGDEFTALLEQVGDAEGAVHLAERLASALDAPIALAGREHRITISMGIVLATGHYARAEEVLRDADVALYRTKDAGRAGYTLFDPTMQAAAAARLALEQDLARALERGEFALHYQPIVDLRAGRAIKVEALIRWHRPGHGLVAPAEFLPLATETGLIRPIGHWVLREACRQAAAWRADGLDIAIAVNLAAREFGDPALVGAVAAALAESSLPPDRLWLEITEGAAMGNAAATVATLGELKTLGVRLAIDDFGTGYSSLAYLRRFPVDELKIDKTLVEGVGTDLDATAIAAAIVTMAQTLGLRVVTEGVETAAQATTLVELGCSLAQGYRFATPLPPDRIPAVLAAGWPSDTPDRAVAD